MQGPSALHVRNDGGSVVMIFGLKWLVVANRICELLMLNSSEVRGPVADRSENMFLG